MPKKAKRKTRQNPITRRKSLVIDVKTLIDDYIYRIDLDADYQREKVWSKSAQEELLDSIVKDIDIPKLYLAKLSNNAQFDYECIDGKQRLLTLLNFFQPDDSDRHPLQVEILNSKYSYKELQEHYPNLAKSIEEYELHFVIYNQVSLNERFLREIFQRLQLGIRLNSGELLNSQLGNMRDFVFKEIGKGGPFLRYTKLSDKRYSRQFTLAQICINSFSRKETGEFVRARLIDIQEFFETQSKISASNPNLERIRQVLKLMDREFGQKAQAISSRAVAVSAYLFVEELFLNRQRAQVAQFAKFYLDLLDAIKTNMELLREYSTPDNTRIMEDFQKYILQASVEPYSIRRRHDFIRDAFEYYKTTTSKNRIIGST